MVQKWFGCDLFLNLETLINFTALLRPQKVSPRGSIIFFSKLLQLGTSELHKTPVIFAMEKERPYSLQDGPDAPHQKAWDAQGTFEVQRLLREISADQNQNETPFRYMHKETMYEF